MMNHGTIDRPQRSGKQIRTSPSQPRLFNYEDVRPTCACTYVPKEGQRSMGMAMDNAYGNILSGYHDSRARSIASARARRG